MKKVLFSLLLAMATFAANATTPDEIFTMFKQMPNASYTHLPKILIKAGLACGKNDVDNDAKDIAEFLRRKNPVVINLEKADRADTRRIVDFLSGVVYAIEGNIQKISNDIFLVTPYNVSVLGSFKEDLKKGVLPWETEAY